MGKVLLTGDGAPQIIFNHAWFGYINNTLSLQVNLSITWKNVLITKAVNGGESR